MNVDRRGREQLAGMEAERALQEASAGIRGFGVSAET